MSARKLWATAFPGRGRLRHPSKAATYRYVQEKAADWQAGLVDLQHLRVYVDDRDGFGWRTYEQLDLAEVSGASADGGEQR